MIKKINDLSDIRGSLPLMSVIQTDFSFPCSDSDGVFCQEFEGEKTLALSLRGVTASICGLSKNVDVEELKAFLGFRQVENILSDFCFDDGVLEKRAVLKVTPRCEFSEDVTAFVSASRLQDYERVFNLLSENGAFEAWYPAFSRKVNDMCACGVYMLEQKTAVSCALAPFVCDGIGIIAGVFTKESHRRRGFATKCVESLLADLKSKNIKTAYLWCEDKNIKLYENIGFTVCGEIYVKREE